MKHLSVVVLGIAILGHAIAALLYAVIITDASIGRIVYFSSKLVVNAIPLLWFFGVERQRFRFPRPVGRALLPGIATGLPMAGFIIVLYKLAFAGKLDSAGLVAKAEVYGLRAHFFLFASFLCVGNAGMEEYYWRWFVFGRLRRIMPLSAAVVGSALGFTLHHIVVLSVYFPRPAWVVIFNAGVFAGGCVWALLYEKCGSIYGPWVSHLLTDVGIMAVTYDLLFRNTLK
jgi:membrane protease YdiL (CAAX protease family)